MPSLSPDANGSREQLLEIEGTPLLNYQRIASGDKPLPLFLTGGGVLGRFVHGHGEAEVFRRDYRSNVPPGSQGPEVEPLCV